MVCDSRQTNPKRHRSEFPDISAGSEPRFVARATAVGPRARITTHALRAPHLSTAGQRGNLVR